MLSLEFFNVVNRQFLIFVGKGDQVIHRARGVDNRWLPLHLAHVAAQLLLASFFFQELYNSLLLALASSAGRLLFRVVLRLLGTLMNLLPLTQVRCRFHPPDLQPPVHAGHNLVHVLYVVAQLAVQALLQQAAGQHRFLLGHAAVDLVFDLGEVLVVHEVEAAVDHVAQLALVLFQGLFRGILTGHQFAGWHALPLRRHSRHGLGFLVDHDRAAFSSDLSTRQRLRFGQPGILLVGHGRGVCLVGSRMRLLANWCLAEQLPRPMLSLNWAQLIQRWLESAQQGFVLAGIIRDLTGDIDALSEVAVAPSLSLRVGRLRHLFHRGVRPIVLFSEGWPIQRQNQGIWRVSRPLEIISSQGERERSGELLVAVGVYVARCMVLALALQPRPSLSSPSFCCTGGQELLDSIVVEKLGCVLESNLVDVFEDGPLVPVHDLAFCVVLVLVDDVLV